MAACGMPLLDLVPDGLHQVGLAHADAAIEEQRVVGLRRTLGDRLAGGVGELVAAADHERVEGVARIQLRGAVPVKARLGAAAAAQDRCVRAERPPSWRTGVAGRIVFRV